MLQQIGTMQGEIEDIERTLASIFTDHGITEITLDDCYQTFAKKIDAHYSSEIWPIRSSGLQKTVLAVLLFLMFPLTQTI